MSESRKIIMMQGSTYIEHLDKQINIIGSQIHNSYGDAMQTQPQAEIEADGVSDACDASVSAPEKHAGRPVNTDIAEVHCLFDLIEPSMQKLYVKQYNELVLPHLKSGNPSMDALSVQDMEFDFTLKPYESVRYKKSDVYNAFSVISAYLKSCYGKEQLAAYLSRHIVSMTSVASFLRYL